VKSAVRKERNMPKKKPAKKKVKKTKKQY